VQRAGQRQSPCAFEFNNKTKTAVAASIHAVQRGVPISGLSSPFHQFRGVNLREKQTKPTRLHFVALQFPIIPYLSLAQMCTKKWRNEIITAVPDHHNQHNYYA